MELHDAHVSEFIDNLQRAGWYGITLEADHWSAMSDIAPLDAAMLLCRFNPKVSYDRAMQTTFEKHKPEQLRRLAQRFEDLSKSKPKPRTLRDWHQAASSMGMEYHPWINDYMEATRPAPVDSAASNHDSGRHAVANAQPQVLGTGNGAKPWLVVDQADPEPKYSWYTPARYFARQLVRKDPTLLSKRQVLADKVAKSMGDASIFKRGGKVCHQGATVLKALANVCLD